MPRKSKLQKSLGGDTSGSGSEEEEEGEEEVYEVERVVGHRLHGHVYSIYYIIYYY